MVYVHMKCHSEQMKCGHLKHVAKRVKGGGMMRLRGDDETEGGKGHNT